MGCPGDLQLAFQLQHELWVSPKKLGFGKFQHPFPLLFVHIVYSGKDGGLPEKPLSYDAVVPKSGASETFYTV